MIQAEKTVLMSKFPFLCQKCGKDLVYKKCDWKNSGIIDHHISYLKNEKAILCYRCHRKVHSNPDDPLHPKDSPRCPECGKLLFWRFRDDGWVCKNWRCSRYHKHCHGSSNGPVLRFENGKWRSYEIQPWWRLPATERQKKVLRQHGIPFTDSLTRLQARKLISMKGVTIA